MTDFEHDAILAVYPNVKIMWLYLNLGQCMWKKQMYCNNIALYGSQLCTEYWTVIAFDSLMDSTSLLQGNAIVLRDLVKMHKYFKASRIGRPAYQGDCIDPIFAHELWNHDGTLNNPPKTNNVRLAYMVQTGSWSISFHIMGVYRQVEDVTELNSRTATEESIAVTEDSWTGTEESRTGTDGSRTGKEDSRTAKE